MSRMLKDTALSLLAGFSAVLLGLVAWFLLNSGFTIASDRSWGGADAIVEIGGAGTGGAGILVQLDGRGRAVLSLPVSTFPAEEYPLLRLVPGDIPHGTRITLLWRSVDSRLDVGAQPLPPVNSDALMLSTVKFPEWQGEISELGMAISGQPYARVSLIKIELQAMTVSRMLATLYRDWHHFAPWGHSSVNTYRGADTATPIAYPLPVAALVLLASVLAYSVTIVLGGQRSRRSFDWRVPGLLVLACWVMLDLLWQARLVRQLSHTYETFTAGDTAAQQLQGIDAPLVSLINEFKSRIPSPARVFVGSKNDYLGMRAAYYLYPRNVYWQRMGPELPDVRQLKMGDYISVIYPTELQYDPENGLINMGSKAYRVEEMLSHPVGSLYRVK